LKLADTLAAHREEFSLLERVCSGNKIMLSRGLELDHSVAFLRYFAGWAGKINGETQNFSLQSIGEERYTAFTQRQTIVV
ncbi:aldehyde dehydrogenase family protein, partial [Salmonella enterica subsp. enterica serovar Infantis]